MGHNAHNAPEAVFPDVLYTFSTSPQPYPAPRAVDAHNTNDKAEKEIVERTGKEHLVAGLKPRTFWIVITTIALIVVAASVGGAVGGTRASQQSTTSVPTPAGALESSSAASSQSPTITSAEPSVATTSSAPTASLIRNKYNIVNDCPGDDGALYTPNAPGGGVGAYQFRKTCGDDLEGPDIISAFVHDFDTCVDLCSNWNYWTYEAGFSTIMCRGVTFLSKGIPPNNCWATNSTSLYASADGMDAMSAVLAS